MTRRLARRSPSPEPPVSSAAASAGLPSRSTLRSVPTTPVYEPRHPDRDRRPRFELGVAGGDGRRESTQYLAAVDAAATGSSPATRGDLGRRTARSSYAIVGTPDRVTPAALAAIRASLEVLRDPHAGDEAVADAALAATPAILWVSANVHGNEESGADASLHALYELAARSDCVVDGILADASSSILPTQNPDGREAADAAQPLRLRHEPRLVRPDPARDRRQARGHPPVPADALHRRPRVRPAELLLPAERRPRVPRDPRHGPRWINELYSPAIAASSIAEGIKYFHGAPYDFFAIDLRRHGPDRRASTPPG